MKSLKVKLFSTISVFVIALSMLIVGVWAVGQSQTITMEGSVNFNVADKSLYVKDVRMQEDNNSTPYSLIEQDKFMPGYINGNFNMDLGEFTNDYGTFALYFDIINTMDESTSETFAYTVDPPTQPSNGTATITILDINGDAIDKIPQGTVKPSQISDSTQASATIKLTVSSTSSSQVDLSEITITINQYVPEVYDYFTFEINEDNQTVTLTDYNPSLSDNTDIVIPSTVSQNADGQWMDGGAYTVTAIAGGSYNNGVFYNSGITSIELPSALTSIGSYAFNDCSSLTSITLPDSLTSIGDGAFWSCGLTGELNLGECTNLTSIGINAFRNCSGLTGKLNLGECTSLISIGSYAFRNCSSLTSITLPDSLTSIGDGAFWSCGLTGELNLGECTNLTSIGINAFRNCSGLTGELNLGECTSLTSIGGSAFSDCSGLTGGLNLGECTSLTSIGESAFYNCSGLTGELNLGECTNLTSIGINAFRNCSGLTGKLNLGECTSLTSIGDYAFYNCSGLTSITLPSSLTSIGNSAFQDCSGLKEVIIDSEYVYTNAKSTSACGRLLYYATTVKVLTSFVKENHEYINSAIFPKVTTEVIDGKNYTVYSK